MLFKMLKGDSSRISLDITPFHDGWCYYTTDDGKLYIDSEDGGKQKRTCINPISGGASRAVSGTLTKNGWVSGRQTLLVAGLQENQNGVIGIAQEVTDSQMEAAKGAVRLQPGRRRTDRSLLWRCSTIRHPRCHYSAGLTGGE